MPHGRTSVKDKNPSHCSGAGRAVVWLHYVTWISDHVAGSSEAFVIRQVDFQKINSSNSNTAPDEIHNVTRYQTLE